MKIKFLGTGAADWPNPGRSVGAGRRFSSLVLDDRILIDCGPMTLDAIDEFNVDVHALDAILIGHPHGDHFNLDVICQIAKRRDASAKPIVLYIDAEAAKNRCGVPDDLADRLQVKGFLPLDCLQVGDYAVNTYPASHPIGIPGELACHFIIKTPTNETMLYGLDGSWFPPTTWHAIQKAKLDVIVWELTCGNLDDWRLGEHSNFGMLKIMANAFKNDGAIQKHTKMFCSHLARTLCPSHDIYARELDTFGFTLAKDGMEWTS